jgi:beta-lactam-binding protein with PASTA domain
MNWLKKALYVVVPLVVFCLSTYVTIGVLLKSEQTVICPDVRGKSVGEAKKLAKERGLSLEVIRYERRREIPRDHVTVQKPGANIATKKGRVLLVIVSEGMPLVEVPTVTGETLERAQEVLTGKQVPVEKAIPVPGQKEGKVVAQSPRGGESILEGKGVVLFVGARMSVYYLMPDVRDMNPDEVEQEMFRKNLKYRASYVRQEGAWRGGGGFIETSVKPGTLFSGDVEIQIRVVYGG